MTRPLVTPDAWQDCLHRLSAVAWNIQVEAWRVFLPESVFEADGWLARVEGWLANPDYAHGPFNELNTRLPAGWIRGMARRYELVREGYFSASALAIFSLGTPPQLEAVVPELQRIDVRHRLTISAVNLWPNGVQADVVAQCGELDLSFHDTSWMSYFHHYAVGREFGFSLTGLALSARKAASPPISLIEPAWLDALLRNAPTGLGYSLNEQGQRIVTIETQGMAALLAKDGFPCIYEFSGTVQELRRLPDIFGQPAWLAVTTVGREFNAPPTGVDTLNLDIVLTRKVWGEAPLPSVGGDIQGVLWLQGCLTSL